MMAGMKPMDVSRQRTGPWVWRMALLALFALAGAWRWAYLARLGHTPFAQSLPFPITYEDFRRKYESWGRLQ